MHQYEDEFEDVLDAARSLLTADEQADFWEANDQVNRALALRPDDPEAWIVKAQVLSALEDDVAALAAIEMAGVREPKSAEIHYWRAAILSDLDRHADALAAIERAFRSIADDDDWLIEDLYCEKAGALESLDRGDEALAVYAAGLARCPGSTILLAGLAPLEKQNLRATLKVLQGGLE